MTSADPLEIVPLDFYEIYCAHPTIQAFLKHLCHLLFMRGKIFRTKITIFPNFKHIGIGNLKMRNEGIKERLSKEMSIMQLLCH